MRLQLTTIALDYDGARFNEGDIVVVGEDIPADLAQARLAAKTAVIVIDGDAPPAEVALAIEAVRAAMGSFADALEVMVVAVETAGGAGALAVKAMADEVREALAPRYDALFPRLHAIEELAREKAAEDLAPPQDDVSSGVDQSEDRLAHNQEVAGSSPASATTDNPSEQTGGLAAPPAEASVSAGDPDAAAGDQSEAPPNTSEAEAGAGEEPTPAVDADPPQPKPRKRGK